MKTIEIKNRFTNEVLYSHRCVDNTIKITLMSAVNSGIDLKRADLKGAKLNLMDLSFASLRNADLSGADLSCSKLKGADLSYIDFNNTDLNSANLSGTDLRGADLRDADLRDADLNGAELMKGCLRGAKMRGVNLTCADLYDSDLHGADVELSKIEFITENLQVSTDEKQRQEIAFQWLSWIAEAKNRSTEEVAIYNSMLEYVNKFQEDNSKKLEKLCM